MCTKVCWCEELKDDYLPIPSFLTIHKICWMGEWANWWTGYYKHVYLCKTRHQYHVQIVCILTRLTSAPAVVWHHLIFIIWGLWHSHDKFRWFCSIQEQASWRRERLSPCTECVNGSNELWTEYVQEPTDKHFPVLCSIPYAMNCVAQLCYGGAILCWHYCKLGSLLETYSRDTGVGNNYSIRTSTSLRLRTYSTYYTVCLRLNPRLLWWLD